MYASSAWKVRDPLFCCRYRRRPIIIAPAASFICAAASVSATKMLCVALLLVAIPGLLVTRPAAAFNVDVSSPIVFEDPGLGGGWNGRESYFGYSVALHNLSSGGGAGTPPVTWVLVGAPRANRSNPGYPPLPTDAKILEPGALYKCSLWADNDGCSEVILDRTGNDDAIEGITPYTDLKDNGWVGVSLDAQPGDDGRVMVCGHLWKQQILSAITREPDFYLPNGVCYWLPAHALSGEPNVVKLLPLIAQEFQTVDMDPPNKKNEYVYALGQAGTAVHFPKDRKQVVLGAPGIFSWRGSAVRLRDRQADAGNSVSAESVASGNAALFGESRIPQLFFTPNISVGDFWGYAVSSGVFRRDGKTLYVAGGPRASWTGKVFIFDYPEGASDSDALDIKWEFTGRQGGEYFGSTVCVADVNSDGLDDLLVGAPLNSVANEGAVYPDQGKVYLYLNHDQNFRDIPDQELSGNRAMEARFGYAISAIGDIDRDGFNDVAIGAPYENGQGAVYIYLGSKEGLSTVSQTIHGAVLSPLLRGFGVSISRGIDMDRNSYPDIAVGSYISGHAVVLRSRPVVKISGTLVPSTNRISINDTDKRFTVRACLTYVGKDVPAQIDVEASLRSDFSYAMPRVNFVLEENPKTLSPTHTYRQTLSRNIENCETFSLEFIPFVKDFSKAVDIKLSHEMLLSPESGSSPSGAVGGGGGGEVVRESLAQTSNPRPVWIKFGQKFGSGVSGNQATPGMLTSAQNASLADFCRNCAVSDPRWPRQVSASIPFLNDCGDDVCVTDLSISASWLDFDPGAPLVIGSKSFGTVFVKVRAKLEPAFVPKAVVHLPSFVPLTSLPRNCIEDRSHADKSIVECELAGPMYAGAEANLTLGLDLSMLQGWMSELRINMTVQSISDEHAATQLDNVFVLKLPLEARADISIQGESDREHFYYLLKEDRPEKDRGKPNRFDLIQYFQISKHLPTPVDQIMAEFRFPIAVAGAKPGPESNFLEVAVRTPSTDHDVKCWLKDSGEGLQPQDASTGENELKKAVLAGVVSDSSARRLTRRDSSGQIRQQPLPHQAAGSPSNGEMAAEAGLAERDSVVMPPSSSDVVENNGGDGGGGGGRGDGGNKKPRPGTRSFLPTAETADAYTVVNCTSGSYRCKTVSCAMGRFVASGATSQLSFNIRIDLGVLEPWLGKNKTVVFETDGVVSYSGDTANVPSLDNFDVRPDFTQVITVFTPVAQVAMKTVPTWVIAVSVAGGILLLLVIIMGLMKAGFFNRAKLRKIEEIRAEEELLKSQQGMAVKDQFDADLSGGSLETVAAGDEVRSNDDDDDDDEEEEEEEAADASGTTSVDVDNDEVHDGGPTDEDLH